MNNKHWLATFLNFVKIAPLCGMVFSLGCVTVPYQDQKTYKDPLSAQDHFRLGQSYESQSWIPQAAKEYRSALKKDGNFLPALGALGSLSYQTGQMKEAERCFKKVLRADTEDASAQNNLALVYVAQLKLDEAERLARSALHSERIRPYAYETLAQIHFRRGDLTQARADLHSALAAAPANNPSLRAALVQTYNDLNRSSHR